MPVPPVKCFWIEPSGRARIAMMVTCAGCDYHAEIVQGEYAYDKATDKDEGPEFFDLDWPRHCENCGREFDFELTETVHDKRSTRRERFYRGADGVEKGLREFGAGAMWDAPWYGSCWQGDDGRTIVVRVPGNEHVPETCDWIIDSPASNCARKGDTTHHCWCRHGEPPELTVDKNCDTCQAGAGSFFHRPSENGWHGHLTNGWLYEAGQPVPPSTPPPPAQNPACMGRRLGDRTWREDIDPSDVQERDFWYVHGGPYDDPNHNRKGHWYVCAPGHHIGGIPHHKVEEHEDGLISVLPLPTEANSIKISTTRPDANGEMQEIVLWHGFIYHGEWRSV